MPFFGQEIDWPQFLTVDLAVNSGSWPSDLHLILLWCALIKCLRFVWVFFSSAKSISVQNLQLQNVSNWQKNSNKFYFDWGEGKKHSGFFWRTCCCTTGSSCGLVRPGGGAAVSIKSVCPEASTVAMRVPKLVVWEHQTMTPSSSSSSSSSLLAGKKRQGNGQSVQWNLDIFLKLVLHSSGTVPHCTGSTFSLEKQRY